MTQSEYLTVQQALNAILSLVDRLSTEQVSLLDALGRVLASPVVAENDMPPFANSAMDGFALRAADITSADGREKPVQLNVVGDVAAGSVSEVTVEPGTAVRIMTGAPMPVGADSVIPVEDTDESWREAERPLPESVQVYRPVGVGDYVRQAGEDIQIGQQVLPAGHRIRPQEIGVLASLGIDRVPVIRRPKIGILATGDELIEVDQPLTPGKIRNSNGYTQVAQVTALGAIPVSLGIARDTVESVRERLQTAVDQQVDMIVSSAGVSVGAYDVVKHVLETDGDINFWRVRMRPGKPLAFGTYQGIPYLGLPGNPVSAMVSFERFVRAAILKMSGFDQLERPQITATIREEIESDGRESYIRAVVTREGEGYTAVTTGNQGSHIMTSLAQANALLIIPEGVKNVSSGAQLTAWMLDWPETVF